MRTQTFVAVGLTRLPAGSELGSVVNRTVSAGDLTKFNEIAALNRLTIRNIGYTLRVEKSAGFDVYVRGATIMMNVDERWVDSQGGPSKIRILRLSDAGAGQILNTTYYGPVNGAYTFRGDSPDGLSLFGLSSVTPIVAPSGGSGGGGAGSVGVAAKKDVNAGEEVVFSIDKTAIHEISLVTKEDVKEVMLTAKKGAMPNGAETPTGDVYQYIGVTVYKADSAVIEKATIRFTVDSAVINGDSSKFTTAYDPARTELLYYDEEEGVWEKLSTVNNGEKDGSYEFFADSAKLGNFAILLNYYVSSGEPLLITDETENPPGLHSESSAPSENNTVSSDESTDYIPPTTSGFLLSGLFSAIGAICIICLSSRVYGRRKNE